MVSCKEAMIVGGILLGFGIGYAFSDRNNGWKYPFFIASPVAVLMFLGMWFLPPSSRWLMLRGDVRGAEEALEFVLDDEEEVEAMLKTMRDQISLLKAQSRASVGSVFGESDRQSGLEDLLHSGSSFAEEEDEEEGSILFDDTALTSRVERSKDGISYIPPSSTGSRSSTSAHGKQQGSLDIVTPSTSKASKILSPPTPQQPRLFDRRYRSALIAGIGLVVLQQITGQPSVLYFMSTLLDNAGVDDLASVYIGSFKLVATLVAVFTVDKFGRRPLLFVGISLMLLALTALTIIFGVEGEADDDAFGTEQVVVLVCLFLYIGGYQVGFGPVSWLIISEIFPLHIRGEAIALGVLSNFFWNLIVTFLFPIMLDAAGSAVTFGLFSVLSILSLIFVYIFVPETKGLTLEEIEHFFTGRGSSDRVSSIARERHDHLLGLGKGNNSQAIRPLLADM